MLRSPLGIVLATVIGVDAIPAPTPAAIIPVGSGANAAELWLEFSDGATYTFDVAFGTSPGDTVSGLELFDIIELETSLTTVRQDFGFGVLIDGVSFDGHSDVGFAGGDNWWHYWTREPAATVWIESLVGVGDRVVADGAADGWVYGRAGPPLPEPGTLTLLGVATAGLVLKRRRTPQQRRLPMPATCRQSRSGHRSPIVGDAYPCHPRCILVGCVLLFTAGQLQAADPWADQVVAFSPSLDGAGLYSDPQSVLGMPATTFWDDTVGQQFSVSLAVGAFNLDAPGGNPLLTTLGPGEFIKVAFDEPVADDPRNPFGIDLIVFGNAAFLGAGFVTPSTNMELYMLNGGLLAETVTAAVSSNGVGDPQTHPENWYVYAQPVADTLFPTNAFRWDRTTGGWGEPSDFTRPVDPALGFGEFFGITAADAIDSYEGSGGGTGFDLAESGFAAIGYVYLTGAGGEVDALADVFPCLGDFDRDGDLDLRDFGVFQGCFADPTGGPRSTGCFCADFDGDGDVDAVDHAGFESALSGPAA